MRKKIRKIKVTYKKKVKRTKVTNKISPKNILGSNGSQTVAATTLFFQFSPLHYIQNILISRLIKRTRGISSKVTILSYVEHQNR